MKHSYLFLFFLCSLSIMAQEQVFVIDIDNQKSNAGSLKMSDLFSDIRYIPLEFNEKYPIGNINDIEITPEYMFINCISTKGQSILKYSLDGKFIEMIGSRGQGPGEYLNGSEMEIDTKNKLMYIRVNFINSIHIYDYIKNKYLRSLKVEDAVRRIKLLNQDFFWSDGDNYLRYTPQYYAWRAIDRNGKIVKTQKSFYFTKNQPSKKPQGVESPNTLLWKHGTGFSYMEMKTDSVFQFDLNFKTYPRFKIKLNTLQQQRGFCFLYETPKRLIVRAYDIETKLYYDGYYDKSKQKYFSYKPVIIPEKPYDFIGIANDFDGGYPFPLFTNCIHFDDSKWYASLLPFKLKEYVKSAEFKKSTAITPDKKEAFRKMVNSLQDDDDPVIVIATLKK